MSPKKKRPVSQTRFLHSWQWFHVNFKIFKSNKSPLTFFSYSWTFFTITSVPWRKRMFFGITKKSDPKLLPKRKTSWPFFVTFLTKKIFWFCWKYCFHLIRVSTMGKMYIFCTHFLRRKKRIIFSSKTLKNRSRCFTFW